MTKTTTTPVMAVNPSENAEKFFARIEPFMSRGELLDVHVAYMLSKYGHRGQARKERVDDIPKRYFEHPRDGAIVIIDELQLYIARIICIILLHDCPEDSREVTLEIIEHIFGSDMARSVKLVTNDFDDVQAYVDRMLVAGDWEALIAKLVDILINMRTWTGKEMALKQLQKVWTYRPIADKLKAICPSALRPNVVKLCGLINLELTIALGKYPELGRVPSY